MTHLMIDLETLGTSPAAPVLSIGACTFDLMTGEIFRTFHEKIDASDALLFGRMTGDTFKWWMKQSDEARAKVTRDGKSAQEAFNDFYGFLRADSDFRNLRPWGNGASFDITILEVAFPRIIKRDAPWKFWNVRDCRTLRELGQLAGFSYDTKREGTHHDALDDAKFQAAEMAFYWSSMQARMKLGTEYRNSVTSAASEFTAKLDTAAHTETAAGSEETLDLLA